LIRIILVAQVVGEKSRPMMNRKVVGLVIFPEVEVLDFCGPYEVLTVTRLNEARRREELSPFQVILVAESSDPLATAAGMRVIPDFTFKQCHRLDILLVPGGWGTRRQLQNEALINWIARQARQVETLAGVCTGSMLLGQAGLLDGRQATTHWRSLAWMRESFPAVTVREDLQVVEDGHILTSAGISAGIDLALKVVARYYGETVAQATARHMEYRFSKDNSPRV
jgi:transcriptional regulator GlxA family with amidase domain